MKIPLVLVFWPVAFATFFLCSAALSNAASRTTVDLRLEIDRTFLTADAPEHAIVKVCLDTSRVPRRGNRAPVDLALVIDRSGSMEGPKIERAKEAVLAAVARLQRDDIFSLVAYDTTVETLVPAQRVGDGRAIERAVRRIRANGSTALFDGVSQAAAEVRKYLESGRYSPRIILLSDGIANVGPSSPEDLGRLGNAFMKEGIPVTTVGLGLGYNEDLMTRLAQRSDGNTYFVESSDDLPGVFNAELGDALSVVARRILVTVTFPEGVRPRGVIGRDEIVDGQTLELQWNQIYGGQEKFALIDVDVAPGRPGEARMLVKAKVTYEDAVEHQSVSAVSECSAEFSSNRARVRRSANLALQADYARTVMAVAKDKAVDLTDAHQNRAAAEQMRAEVARLRGLASKKWTVD